MASVEAERRQHEFGPNEVSHARQASLVRRFLHQFTHFFALVLWAAAVLAFVSAWQEPGQGMETLGFAILGVILVNGVFSFVQEYRAERALASLRRLLPGEVKVLRDSQVCLLPASALVPGDVLVLEEGRKAWVRRP
nr:cation-transporting P-type ATPase [Corallococcus sp. AB045]